MIPILLVALTAGWLVLLVTAAVAPTPLATLVYAVGALICHQCPERSFHLDAAQLPVCARCLGVYAGAALGALSRLVAGADPVPRARPILMLGLVPTLVTLVLEWTGLWAANNLVRLLAGLPIGLAAAVVLVPRLRAPRLRVNY